MESGRGRGKQDRGSAVRDDVELEGEGCNVLDTGNVSRTR